MSFESFQGSDCNVININPSELNYEYFVDLDATIDRLLEDLPEDISDEDWFAADDKMISDIPEYFRLTLERVLVHEILHSLQPDFNIFNDDHFEMENIRRTNEIMHIYFSEPFRFNHSRGRWSYD